MDGALLIEKAEHSHISQQFVRVSGLSVSISMTSFDSDPTDLQSPQSGERSAPVSLSSAHILKALQDSPDNGATLIFSRLRLSDVGPAEELANIGRENSQDQGCLKRYSNWMLSAVY